MKHIFKEPSFSAKYLKKVKWTEFRNQYMNSSIINVANDIELYLLFKRHSGRKVVGMERKIKDKERKLRDAELKLNK